MTTANRRDYHSHYLFQVVPLLRECKENLGRAITQIHFSPGRFESLYRLQTSLTATEELLCAYVFRIVQLGQGNEEEMTSDDRSGKGDIYRALEYLEHISGREECLRNPQEASVRPSHSSFYETAISNDRQSAESQLLFRLVVIFQLLLVRIDDAHSVITGHRINQKESSLKTKETLDRHQEQRILPSTIGMCFLGAGMILGFLDRKQSLGTTALRMKLPKSNYSTRQLIGATAKIGSSILGFMLVKGFLNVCWMTDKIVRSNNELLEWNHQWKLIHSVVAKNHPMPLEQRSHHNQYSSPPASSILPMQPTESLFLNGSSHKNGGITDEKSRMLLEYAQKHGRTSQYFWRSTGEIRFLMIKRFMEIYYASVGVGVNCTRNTFHPDQQKIVIPLVAGAAASFYTITGSAPSTPALIRETESSSSASAKELIQHAWGMVSLPVLKDLMLQASRLVKGASVADRIVLCGVPCFILSKDPAPELAAILQRHQTGRENSSGNLSRLSTIAEDSEIADEMSTNSSSVRRKSFVGSRDGQYRQRDVILHLTGGGFFAHTIASDLPYLLDWSSSTGAVVICPEYSLLPEHQFPTQLDEIATIYTALANGNTGEELGFDANSIIVTGESAGGNLAAALCVKLAQQQVPKCDDDEIDTQYEDETKRKTQLSTPSRMPNAIMLSCPALNLTTELSPSRILGTEDPVLPNALISAISEAYLAKQQDGIVCDMKHPLVSPCYAHDSILSKFPPTLIFASSRDPLLDDSVTFNERLKVLGVDSELMAVHNVPHAYLGLGTAGFPEAVRVQQYAMDWLSSKFSE